MSKKLYTPRKEKPLKVKHFIARFDFPNPDWSTTPSGFPYMDKTGLTKQEGHLLDGIKLAWVVSDGGREHLYKSVARKALLGVTAIVLIFLTINLLTKPVSLTKNVEAKTVRQAVGAVVEATMSAVFRK